MMSRQLTWHFAMLLFILSATTLYAQQEETNTPSEPPREPLDESTLSEKQALALEKVRGFGNSLRTGEFEKAKEAFAVAARAGVAADYLKSAWAEVETQKGKWQKDVVYKVTDIPQEMMVVAADSYFEKGALEFGYVCDAEGAILQIIYFLDPPADIATLFDEFVELLMKEEYEEVIEMFDEVVKGILTPESLQQGSEQFQAQLGKLTGYDKLRSLPNPVYTIILAELVFDRGRMVGQIVFNDKKEIAGYAFLPQGEIDLESMLAPVMGKEEEASE